MCVCGGVIETSFLALGLAFAWKYVKRACKALGCLCKCHDKDSTKPSENKDGKDDKKEA